MNCIPSSLRQVALPALFTLLFILFSAQAGQRALLIGINDYGDDRHNLHGAVADAERVKALLIDKFGFKESDIMMLTNKQATTSAVIKAYKRQLMEGVSPNDTVLFYFSGHGSSVQDLDGDEADMRDEMLCTVDVDPRNQSTWLTDDVLYQLQRQIPTQRYVAIHDCCHSGTSYRIATSSNGGLPEGTRSRYMPLDFAPVPGIPESVRLRSSTVKSANDNPNHLFLAACTDRQEALEASLGDGSYGGVFTIELVSLINSLGPDVTLADLQDRLRGAVADRARQISRGKAVQTPQFYGGNIRYAVNDYLAEKPRHVFHAPAFPDTPALDLDAPGDSPSAAPTPPVQLASIEHNPVLPGAPVAAQPSMIGGEGSAVETVATASVGASTSPLTNATPDGSPSSPAPGTTPPAISPAAQEGVPAVNVPLENLDALIAGWQPEGSIKITVKTDKQFYIKDDVMRVTVSADRDCYLRLYNINAENQVVQIFPNKFQQDHFIKAGEKVSIPDARADFEFRMGKPYGNELLRAVASTRPFTDTESQKYEQAIFQDLGTTDLQSLATRGIHVRAKPNEKGEALVIYNVENE